MKEITVRFMIQVRANRDSEAGVLPDEKLIATMAAYHEELAKAGVLLDGSGLQPSAKGWRVRYEGERRQIIDGPFAETKELIAGYTLIQVKSVEEAREWTRRFPNPFPQASPGERCEIEVRRLYELEEILPGGAAQRFREIGMGGEKR